MWYNRLSGYLIKELYKNNLICSCLFVKISEFGFAIIAIYVNDMNLIRTLEVLLKTTECLKRQFKMKDLEKMKLYIGLQIEHKTNSVLIHHLTYVEKILKHFNMNNAHPLSTHIVCSVSRSKKGSILPQRG